MFVGAGMTARPQNDMRPPLAVADLDAVALRPRIGRTGSARPYEAVSWNNAQCG